MEQTNHPGFISFRITSDNMRNIIDNLVRCRRWPWCFISTVLTRVQFRHGSITSKLNIRGLCLLEWPASKYQHRHGSNSWVDINVGHVVLGTAQVDVVFTAFNLINVSLNRTQMLNVKYRPSLAALAFRISA